MKRFAPIFCLIALSAHQIIFQIACPSSVAVFITLDYAKLADF